MTIQRFNTRDGSRATLLAVTLAVALSSAVAQTPPAEHSDGLRIMLDRNGGNCIACHALPGQTGVISTFGPPLHKVGARYDELTLRRWVTDARQINADTLMPPFGTLQGTQRVNSTQPMLTPEQINQVVAALQTLR